MNEESEVTQLKRIHYHTIEFKQFIKKYDLVFSPRTTLAKEKDQDI